MAAPGDKFIRVLCHGSSIPPVTRCEHALSIRSHILFKALMAEELQEIQVQFITKLQDAIVPDTPFSVPVRLTRYGLSGVVNHLLGQDPPRPFDFFIDGKFLRTSLAQYLQANKVSAVCVTLNSFITHPFFLSSSAFSGICVGIGVCRSSA
jgi:hypothetical protein